MQTMAQFSRLSDDNTASGEDIYTIDIYTVAHTEMETAPITRSYFERTPAVETLELESLARGGKLRRRAADQTQTVLQPGAGHGVTMSGCHGDV